MAAAIERGHVIIGMDQEQVTVVLGTAAKRTSFGGRPPVDVWIYPAARFHQDQLHAHGATLFRLLFRDGRLVSYDKRRPSPEMQHIEYGVSLLRHAALERNRRDGVIASILMTIFLGAIFLCGQAYEYGVLNGAAFNVRSGVFGTTFFMLTGFHGLHVLMGLVFLNVVYGAVLKGRITPEQHFPFRAASWYWHFVDVVWLFVFTIVYLL